MSRTYRPDSLARRAPAGRSNNAPDWRAMLLQREQKRAARSHRQARRPAAGNVRILALFVLFAALFLASAVWQVLAPVAAALRAVSL